VIRVFERSKRSEPVFNDKHLSYNWNDAKWMFDKSRELNFPLTGGSSIPTYFRTPEIDLAIDTPIKNSIVVGGTADEGAIFHCVDVLQAFVERRKGGETGVKSVPYIRRYATPIKNSIVVGGTADEGAIFHCVDVLQAFVERRKGGETGVKSVQSIR